MVARVIQNRKQTNLQNQCFVNYRQRQRRQNTGAELTISFSIGYIYQMSLEMLHSNMMNIPKNKEWNASRPKKTVGKVANVMEMKVDKRNIENSG